MTTAQNKVIKNIALYTIAVLICGILLVWILQLWTMDFKIPITYSGDGLFYGMMVKGMIDNGWYLENPYLGAPAGLLLYDDISLGADNVHYLIIKLIFLFTSDWAVVFNIFILLTFPLTTLFALMVFRRFNISWGTSILGSLLFAFLPYHFIRTLPHTFLAAYYAVPFGVFLALLVFSERPPFLDQNEDGKWALFRWGSFFSIVLCLLISGCGIYYAFFSCFFILVAGISAALAEKK